jgi:hypothetical protein
MPDDEWIKTLEDGRKVKFIYQEFYQELQTERGCCADRDYDPGSGLAEIFALTWVFIALVIGKVGLNILRWFTLGFDYAGNGLGPSTGCAGPSCKLRVLLKNELSARRCHDHSFPQAGGDYQTVEIR